MNPKVIAAIYGSAFTGAIVLGIAYTLWKNKQDKKHPIKSPRSAPCLNDTENGERRVNPKFVKVICSGAERS